MTARPMIPDRAANRLGAVALLTAVFLTAGCSRTSPSSPVVSYRLGVKDGMLTMTLGKLTLEFEGVAAEPGVSGKGGSILISTVPGASGGGSDRFDGVEVKHQVADGVATVTVGATTFKLTEGGAKLVLGDRTYNLSDEQTVTVAKDGKPR